MSAEISVSDTNLDRSALCSVSSTATARKKTSGRHPRRQSRKSKQPINYLHAAALAYLALGLPITLCMGKAPWHTGWQTLEWTPESIDKAYQQRPAANVGVVLGQRSGLVDFDCDGPDAERTLLELFDGEIPTTPSWQSQRGLHRLFKWHPALERLGKNKLVIGEDDGKVEILIGPNVQTLLPPSYVGMKREWVEGTQALDAAVIPDSVLLQLGCTLGEEGAERASSALLITDRCPTSVVSVVSVVSVSTLDDTTNQQARAVVQRCVVKGAGTTNAKFLSLVIGLKSIAGLKGVMGEDLEPFIRAWYYVSVPHMKEKDWNEVWGRWLYLWGWAETGHDVVQLAYETSQQEPLPAIAQAFSVRAIQRLVGLCHVLQRDHADDRGVWYLSCRSAAAVIGVEYPAAAKFLRLLIQREVLELVEPGTKVKAARYRYCAA